MSPAHDAYLTADEATARLGIRAATLYAYVSRGLVESRPGRDRRSRVYRRRDVDRLAARKRAGRGAARGAAQSLDRGLPVMETRISLIRADGPYYRGHSAIGLVRRGATLEDAARILWDCVAEDPFAVAPPVAWPRTATAIATQVTLPALVRTLATIPLLASDAPSGIDASASESNAIAARLLRQNAALLVGRRAGKAPVHQLLSRAWRRRDARFGDLVRAALVLCADHELNVSAFAARVVASTGAPLHATVCTGLAALSGPRHGGATARAFEFIAETHGAGSIAARIDARAQRGDDLPGFGHALCPDGDPRATELLAMLRTSCKGSESLSHIDRLLAQAEHGGQYPNIDFMLAAIAWCHGLGAEAALVLFAAGRVAGWLAHALEQQDHGGFIRPRARYSGEPPRE